MPQLSWTHNNPVHDRRSATHSHCTLPELSACWTSLDPCHPLLLALAVLAVSAPASTPPDPLAVHYTTVAASLSQIVWDLVELADLDLVAPRWPYPARDHNPRLGTFCWAFRHPHKSRRDSYISCHLLAAMHTKNPLTGLTSLEILLLAFVLTLLLLACLYPHAIEPECPNPILLAPRFQPHSISPPKSRPGWLLQPWTDSLPPPHLSLLLSPCTRCIGSATPCQPHSPWFARFALCTAQPIINSTSLTPASLGNKTFGGKTTPLTGVSVSLATNHHAGLPPRAHRLSHPCCHLHLPLCHHLWQNPRRSHHLLPHHPPPLGPISS